MERKGCALGAEQQRALSACVLAGDGMEMEKRNEGTESRGA